MSAPVSDAVRRTTVAAVLLVAAVAAIASYAHMREVADRAGEAWRSYLLPLSVDGLMVAASMVLLTRRRAGLPGGALAWSALLAGVVASLAANMAAAEATVTARLVAAWPALAFAVAFELLLEQRRPVVPEPALQPAAAGGPAVAPAPTGWETTSPAPAPAPAPGVAVPDPAPAAPGHRPVPGPAPAPVPVGPLVTRRTEPPAPVPAKQRAPGGGDELTARAAELIAAADKPPGRRALARQLGCTEHAARTVLDTLTPPTTAAVAGNGAGHRKGR